MLDSKLNFFFFGGGLFVFYSYFMWIGSVESRKNFRVGNFLSKNLLGKGFRKQKTFLGLLVKLFMG